MHQGEGSAVSVGTALNGGRRLGWSVAGAGAPAVVLEAGLSGGSAGWAQVMAELAQVTRVIAYDRAGYGSSDPTEPTPESVVDDLRAVLDDTGAHSPFVLVGHSWGGVVARLFAAEHPDRVGALVLLDATHEDLPSARNRVVRTLNIGGARLLSRRARSGRLRRDLVAGKGRLARVAALVPVEHRARMVDHLSAASTWEQTAREAASIPRLLDAVRAARLPAADVTAVVGGRSAGRSETRTRKQVRSLYEAWLGPQCVTVVEQAGHMLPLEAPHEVARHVLGVIDSVRQS